LRYYRLSFNDKSIRYYYDAIDKVLSKAKNYKTFKVLKLK